MLISSDEFVVARVPEGAASGPVVVGANGNLSNAHSMKVAVPVADSVKGDPNATVVGLAVTTVVEAAIPDAEILTSTELLVDPV